MNRAEQEVVDLICRELALALRRITGRKVKFSPGELPVSIDVMNEINAAIEAETASDEKDADT